jgi:YD repeat-containing protein
LITAVASPGPRKSRAGIDDEGVGVLDGGVDEDVDAVDEQLARPNAPTATRRTARRPSTTTGYRASGRLVAWTLTDRLAW